MSPIIHMMRFENGKEIIACQPKREAGFCKFLIEKNRTSQDPKVVTCKDCRRHEIKRELREMET